MPHLSPSAGRFPLALALLLLVRASAQTSPAVPTTGTFVPGMERFDATVIELMNRFDSPGAQLAIMRNGRLVLARGYGYADRESQIAVQPDALFRVASLSKFVTALAVLALVEQGQLDLEARVFPLLGLTPLPGAANADPRLQTITVRHLLHHTGGWDRNISGDLTFSTTMIATAAGVPPPADVDTIIRYYLGLRLDFDPGARHAYSNFGYVVLGRLIEKITGQPYARYVQTAVLGKAGITRAVPGRSHLENRQAGEVRYYDYPGAPLVRSAFPPTSALVPNPYGGFTMENRYATGAWLFTTIDYVRLLAAVDGSRAGAGILTPASIDLLTERPAAPVAATGVNYYAMGLNMNVANGPGLSGNWFHGGSLPGSSTYMVRFAGGWSYAIFLNSRPNGVDDTGSSDIATAMRATLDSTVPPATGDLLLTARPEFVAGPTSVTAGVGTTPTFTASVSSFSSPTHQWFKDGVAIAGATAPSLTLPPVVPGSAGSYHLVTTNVAGSSTSPAATLTIATPTDTGRLVNLSVLTTLGDSSDQFTMGYVAGGAGTSGAKPLLVRAAGPALGALGVPDTIADPKLELYVGATLRGQNDDWGGTPALSAAMAGVGAFAYADPTSRDAAALTSVNAGENNSVKVSGTGTGQVIAELYDATPSGQSLPTTPRLLNVSVLKHLGAGLTVGFSVGGSTPLKVLVRAIGPTLGEAPFDVEGAVADPQLVLFRDSSQIGENNDWGGGPDLTGAFTQVGAFALPRSSRDAALLVTLSPGGYSAMVTGRNSTTGMALVEVYEVPERR